MKILALEDDPVERAILREALQRLDYDVIAAAEGEAAWVAVWR
ncbi:MAG: response regulator [Opitutaceae bacterium]|nr:response regulator [Opitutaceae bacterium]